MNDLYWDGCIDNWDDFEPETTSDDDQDALAYWGVATVDEPISLEPFPCGQYVCDEGHPHEQAS